LTKEECNRILKGDRLAIKKIGVKTSVIKRRSGDIATGPYKDVVFLTDNYSGGEVHSDGQIIYPVTGRRLRGKIILQPVRDGEQWIVEVGS
jgi:hypothetical protein